MKKVLIISYFFEPANFVGAQRVNSWKTYLPESNIYPIILTRFWRENQTNLNKIKGTKKVDVSINDQFEIHRIPEKWRFRDLIIESNKYIFLRKVLTFFQILFDILYFRKSQYYFLYREAINIIVKNKDLDTVIISGTPFHSFAVGYYLKVKFPHLKWYPDYRDQWSTHNYLKDNGLLQGIIAFLEKYKERKWTSNASKFITVSENWMERIEKHISKKGLVVKNGLDVEIKNINNISIPRNASRLCISYVGTLYPYQRIDMLLNVIKKIKIEFNYDIEVNFIGINALKNYQIKILNDFPELKENLTFFERMPERNLHEIYNQSDLLWLTSFNEMKGWYPVKLFDYAKEGIPILLFPSDNDVMERFISECSVGFAFDDKNEVHQFLLDLLFHKEKYHVKINHSKLNEYTRKTQSKILAELIKNE